MPPYGSAQTVTPLRPMSTVLLTGQVSGGKTRRWRGLGLELGVRSCWPCAGDIFFFKGCEGVLMGFSSRVVWERWNQWSVEEIASGNWVQRIERREDVCELVDVGGHGWDYIYS